MPTQLPSAFPVKSLFFFAIASLLFFSGCTSKRSRTAETENNTQAGNAHSSASNPLVRQFDGGTYCVQTFAQGPAPAQPLHFSNKISQSDGSVKDFESDLASDTFTLTTFERRPATDSDRQFNADFAKKGMGIPIKDGFAETTRTNQYQRSDASGWNMGPSSVAMGGTPWGLFVSKPIVTPAGNEAVNGFDTVKYAVDTTRQSTLDKSALLAFGKLKDYNITGTAWVDKAANCVLQYNIDYEEDGRDGKVSKSHYEGTVTKK